MGGCEREVKESSSFSSQGWMLHLVFNTCQNPKEVGSDASDGVGLLVRWEHTGKKQQLPSSMCLNRLPAKGVAKRKGVLPHLKIRIKGVSSHLSDPVWKRFFPLQRKQKSLTSAPLHFRVLVNSSWQPRTAITLSYKNSYKDIWWSWSYGHWPER